MLAHGRDDDNTNIVVVFCYCVTERKLGEHLTIGGIHFLGTVKSQMPNVASGGFNNKRLSHAVDATAWLSQVLCETQ
jgi:hypothetical protein